MSHFIIAVANATTEQRDGLTRYVGTLGGYWHWMPDLWLLNTPGDEDIFDIRDSLNRNQPLLVCLVLKVTVQTAYDWAGVFPTEAAAQWSEWLNKYWGGGAPRLP